MVTAHISTIVVIIGDDTSAGARGTAFARIGIQQPINLARITTAKRVTATTAPTIICPETNHIQKKLNTARAVPTIRDMENSFQITLKMSLILISSSASPRIIVTEACEPQLPPVSISIGINDTITGRAEIASSNPEMILPVIVDVNISKISHGILFFACLKAEVLR